MMNNKQLTILIVEDEAMECKQLEYAISQIDHFRLSAVTNSSSEALELTKYQLPDVVILDLELHKGSGNGILYLQQLHALTLNPMPFILVTTHNPSSVTHQIARDLGADLILVKSEDGYCAEYVVQMLQIMCDPILKSRKEPSSNPSPVISPEMLDQRLRQRIIREMDLIGVLPKYKGYHYLVDAILLIYHEKETNITTTLGQKYGLAPTTVERAMQHAIQQAWTHTAIEDLLHHYTARISPHRASPTLMEFVYYYASKLENELC